MTTDVKLNQEQFGDVNETAFFNLLKQNGITNITQTDKYTPYDFKIKINNRIVYIELKTRTISKEQYDTTILAVNKIQYYKDIRTRRMTEEWRVIRQFGAANKKKALVS